MGRTWREGIGSGVTQRRAAVHLLHDQERGRAGKSMVSSLGLPRGQDVLATFREITGETNSTFLSANRLWII